MKKLLENCEEYLNYFLYYPDKTLVITQVYFLNPIYSFVEKVVDLLFKNIRKSILFFLENRKVM